jgi:CheY-like chemotaxis protein
MNPKPILLVEDNPNDEALMLRALKKHEIPNPVVVVRDGAEALEYLFATGAHAGRSAEEQPQVVFLDLNLPKLGGLEVLRRLREDPRTRLIPVVVLTSSSEDRDLSEAYAVGANSYVVKPVDFTQFSEAIRQIAQYWLVLNRPLSPRRDRA